MFDSLNLSLIGILIGIVGLALVIYQIFQKSGPSLVYQYFGQRLIDGSGGLLPKQVEVQYDGKPIPRLSLTHIVIWNAGRVPLRQDDIVSKHPISFNFNGGEIIKAEVVKRTRSANESEVRISENGNEGIIFSFSFLDYMDGALIRIFHTGSANRPKCSGIIIGLPKGIEPFGVLPFLPSSKLLTTYDTDGPKALVSLRQFIQKVPLQAFFAIMFLSLGIIGITILIAAIFPAVLVPFEIDLSGTERIIMAGYGFINGLGGLLIFCLYLWLEKRWFPVSLMPDELLKEQGENSA